MKNTFKKAFGNKEGIMTVSEIAKNTIEVSFRSTRKTQKVMGTCRNIMDDFRTENGVVEAECTFGKDEFGYCQLIITYTTMENMTQVEALEYAIANWDVTDAEREEFKAQLAELNAEEIAEVATAEEESEFVEDGIYIDGDAVAEVTYNCETKMYDIIATEGNETVEVSTTEPSFYLKNAVKIELVNVHLTDEELKAVNDANAGNIIHSDAVRGEIDGEMCHLWDASGNRRGVVSTTIYLWVGRYYGLKKYEVAKLCKTGSARDTLDAIAKSGTQLNAEEIELINWKRENNIMYDVIDGGKIVGDMVHLFVRGKYQSKISVARLAKWKTGVNNGN